MLNRLIIAGEEEAQKGETNYKHVCYIVRGKDRFKVQNE